VASRVLCVLVGGLIAYSALRSGGYYARDFLLVGVAAFVASGIGLVLVGGRWSPSPWAMLALASLFGLTAWTGLSAAWSPDPAAADVAMQRCLAYAAAFLLCALAVGNGRSAALLLRLVVGVLVGVCVVALVSRLRPELIETDPTLLAFSQGRLAYPLGYWNAMGAVAAMAIIGCLGLAADAREHLVLRALYAAGGTLATCTLYLTISRGAGLALVFALAVVLALSPRRLRLAISGAAMLGAGAVGVLVLRSHPVLVDRPATIAQQSDEGAAVLVALVVIATCAAGVQIALGRVRALNRERSATSFRRRSAPPVAVYGVPAVVVALLFAGVYATSSDTVEGQAANGTLNLRSFVDRQYDAFMDTAKPPPVGQERLTSARSSRSEAYRVAIDALQANPLAGDGAGGYPVRWAREREVGENFRNAHSLELETASELGLVGLLLLGGLLVPLGAGLQRIRKAGGGLTRSQAAAAGGVVMVWMVHSALDWDWQMGAVTLPALACGAVLLAQGQRSARSGAGMFARLRTAGSTGNRPYA
jgi:O-antigen ligase